MMALGIAAFFYIVVALLFCLVIWRRYSKAQSAVELIIILLTPGVGLLVLLFLHVGIRLFHLEKGEVEFMPEEENLFSLQDRGYDDEIIPMNDIFLLDDAKVKRKYFTDAIRQDMVVNQDILQMAVHDTDREIAYFAVSLMTAKMEELGDELFRLEQQLKKAPNDAELLKEYVEKLKLFLHSGYGTEMDKKQQRQAYISALELLNQQIPNQAVYYTERIHMLIISNRLKEACRVCQEFASTHTGQEEPILMEIQVYQALHDEAKLQKKIQQLKALPQRLSPEALRVIRFWDKEAVHA